MPKTTTLSLPTLKARSLPILKTRIQRAGRERDLDPPESPPSPRARLCRAVGPERLEGVNQRSAERPDTIAASASRASPRSPPIRAPLKPFASREKAH